MTPTEIEKILLDPVSVYKRPEDVLADAVLSNGEKVEVLLSWQYNASDEAVALEEGMPGEETDVLRQILIALGRLAGPIDVEHTAPTKQHGLPRGSLSIVA